MIQDNNLSSSATDFPTTRCDLVDAIDEFEKMHGRKPQMMWVPPGMEASLREIYRSGLDRWQRPAWILGMQVVWNASEFKLLCPLPDEDNPVQHMLPPWPNEDAALGSVTMEQLMNRAAHDAATILMWSHNSRRDYLRTLGEVTQILVRYHLNEML